MTGRSTGRTAGRPYGSRGTSGTSCNQGHERDPILWTSLRVAVPGSLADEGTGPCWCCLWRIRPAGVPADLGGLLPLDAAFAGRRLTCLAWLGATVFTRPLGVLRGLRVLACHRATRPSAEPLGAGHWPDGRPMPGTRACRHGSGHQLAPER